MMMQFQFRIGDAELIQSSVAYRLYAWLLQQIPEDFADGLHQAGDSPISQSLYYDRQQRQNIWRINLLSATSIEILQPVLEQVKQVDLHAERLSISLLSKKCYSSAEEMILSVRNRQSECRRWEMHFLTPTAFKQAGRYTIIPQIHLLVQSLLMKWNAVCSEYSLEDEDFMNALLQELEITDYSLRTTRFPLKGVRIPGFYGKVVITSHLAAPLEEVWQLLMEFAGFSGIGIKTTLGMGGVMCCQATENQRK